MAVFYCRKCKNTPKQITLRNLWRHQLWGHFGTRIKNQEMLTNFWKFSNRIWNITKFWRENLNFAIFVLYWSIQNLIPKNLKIFKFWKKHVFLYFASKIRPELKFWAAHALCGRRYWGNNFRKKLLRNFSAKIMVFEKSLYFTKNALSSTLI